MKLLLYWMTQNCTLLPAFLVPSFLSRLRSRTQVFCFTLGTTVFAFKGSKDPDRVIIVNGCMAMLIKKHMP
jgi:hypothetical protein